MGPLYPIYNPDRSKAIKPMIKSSEKGNKQDFKRIFDETIRSLSSLNLSFSKHALKRAQQRGISFGEKDLRKISSAVDRMQKKGSREALLLYKDLGLLVNVKERRIITCVDRERLKEDVFTNIDGVMLVE